MHHKGYTEFRYWYVRQSQKPWSQVRDDGSRWKDLPTEHKYHWYLVKRAMGVLQGKKPYPAFRPKVSVEAQHVKNGVFLSNTSGTSQLEDDLNVLGLLLTYCPVLGMDDPEVGSLIRGGLRGDALRKALISRRAHQAYFYDLSAFIQQLRSKYGFASCCACMEMGDHTSFPAQVHCHGFLCFLRRQSKVIHALQVSVSLSSLTFNKLKPHYVATRGLRGRRLYEATAQGMHYVVGPKCSGMFRFTDLEPIQDVFAML
jgi:hypothetical protein